MSLSTSPSPSSPPPLPVTSTWSPLRQPVFRTLWFASAVSLIGTWMHDVGAAWLMTSLSPSPFLVALMQAAGSLPFFLLALPAGAIADVIDRRKMLLFTQGWMGLMAAGLGVLTLMGLSTPWTLLLFTFALSLGSAMNLPVWQAIIPELVSRAELSAASTLNGIVINLARLVGPALAGLVIGLSNNPGVVFLLNAASFVAVWVALYQWKRTQAVAAMPAERFMGAIQAGIRYARFAPVLQTVFIRSAAYIFFASALFALLPILGRRVLGLDAMGYGLVLGFWGIGGLAGAYLLPKVRQRASTDQVVAGASAVFGLMLLGLAYVRDIHLIWGVMVVVGIASLAVMVSLNVTAQTAVPQWVRARALAINLLLFQGIMTLGSLLWGAIAQQSSISVALAVAGCGLIATVCLSPRFRLQCAERLDLASSLHWSEPIHAFEPCPNDGPVMVSREYRIDPANTEAFLAALSRLSQIRRRDGAIQWGIYQDLSDPGRFVETALIESWAEHRRQFERVTNSDRDIEAQVDAFHIGEHPPRVSQFIHAESRSDPDCGCG